MLTTVHTYNSLIRQPTLINLDLDLLESGRFIGQGRADGPHTWTRAAVVHTSCDVTFVGRHAL